MAKRKPQHSHEAEFTEGDDISPQPDATQENAAYVLPSPSLARLLESKIIEIADGEIMWREGHLLHLAHQYLSDMEIAQALWRDDFELIKQYSWDEFLILLEAIADGERR
jgi:hypothetical protein